MANSTGRVVFGIGILLIVFFQLGILFQKVTSDFITPKQTTTTTATTAAATVVTKTKHQKNVVVDDAPIIENSNTNDVPAAAASKTTAAAAAASTKEVDLRKSIQRPFMETASVTYLDTIQRIEDTFHPSPECSAFGGLKYIHGLQSSKETLLKPPRGGGGGGFLRSSSSSNPTTTDKDDASQITWYGNDKMQIFYAENVAVTVEYPSSESGWNDWEAKGMDATKASYKLQINGQLANPTKTMKTITDEKRQTVLQYMTNGLTEKSLLSNNECTDNYIEYPVLLVDSDLDANNWWFFLMAILKHYIVLTILQPTLQGNYPPTPLKILHTTRNYQYAKPFVDAFDFMFANGGDLRDSSTLLRMFDDNPSAENFEQQQQQPNNDSMTTTTPITKKQFCFRKLLWSPGNFGNSIFINKKHPFSHCASSIVTAYAAQLKASLHIPTLPRPKKPRIIWVGRSAVAADNPSPWQARRIIENQPEVVEYLQKKCDKLQMELIVANFFGEPNGQTAFQEQALTASRANIMIGIHGAGLNMFHFMPFDSVVVELHMGTEVQKNSANYVNYTNRQGKYISQNGNNLLRKQQQTRQFEPEKIWNVVQEAVVEWEQLGK